MARGAFKKEREDRGSASVLLRLGFRTLMLSGSIPPEVTSSTGLWLASLYRPIADPNSKAFALEPQQLAHRTELQIRPYEKTSVSVHAGGVSQNKSRM